MKKSPVLMATALLVLALTGCSQAAPPASTSAPSSTTSQSAPSSASSQQGAPTAKAVWDSTLASGSYKGWATAPSYETMQPAKGPHGKFVQVFVDPTISSTLSGAAATTWPVGGMIVKDAFDDNKGLIAIEFMQKTDTGWFFASYDVDGNVAAEGVAVEPCQGCHTKNSSDGVKSFNLPQ